MSRPLPRIPKELAATLPWSALLEHFSVQTITQLEIACSLPDGTLARAERGRYGTPQVSQVSRGLSAKSHQILLENIARRFHSGEQMRGWMQKHWPPTLLAQSRDVLEALYHQVDLASQVPLLGIFPRDFIERPEADTLLNLLLHDRQTRVLWLTGPGGTGKSTLALSLLRRSAPLLLPHFQHLLWIDVGSGGFEHGLNRAIDQLNLPGVTNEADFIRLASRKAILLVLDTLHGLDDLPRWQQLVGSMGKLVVTSRTRLTEGELRIHDHLRQVELGGFSPDQAFRFLGKDGTEIEQLVRQTAGLPLALRILSGLMQELGYSPAELVAKLETAAIQTLIHPPDNPHFNLRVCFDLTFQALREKHPLASGFFRAAGLFQTPTLLIPLLADAAGVEHADPLVAILLRYNLAEFFTFQDEHFLKLHPLVHQFARELASDEQERYQLAVYAWVKRAHLALEDGIQWSSLHFHILDGIFALEQSLRQANWLDAARHLHVILDLAYMEDPLGRAGWLTTLGQLIPIDDASRPIVLLKMMIRDLQAKLQDETGNWATAWELRQDLRTELESFSPGDDDPDIVWLYGHTYASTLYEMAVIMKQQGWFDQALEFLQSSQNIAILQQGEYDRERLRLQAEIFQEQEQHTRALETYQEIERILQKSPASRIEHTFNLVLQADCYLALDKLDKARELYEAAFAEEKTPPFVRAAFGESLLDCLDMQDDLQRKDEVLEIVLSLMNASWTETFDDFQARTLARQTRVRQGLGK